jgi:hypothetical protein
MINEYVNRLIENLPDDTKTLQKIDLVLDGGLFNGSYLVGALYFLKEMEKRNYLKIERISGCSIGSVIAFLYYIDGLDIMPKLYELANNEFKKDFKLNIVKKLNFYLKDRIPDDICSTVNGKLFICYNDIKKHKKIVKSTYKNVDEIMDAIVKSSFLPFLIDNNMFYKKKYVDGMNAYIFNKNKDKKILHMELFSFDKFTYAINIKNEKTNFHRIMSGLLDIHCFFIKKSNTPMCSYVDDWNIINTFNYSIKILFEKIVIYILYLINYFKKYLSKDFNDNLIVKIISKLTFDIFSLILENYCL